MINFYNVLFYPSALAMYMYMGDQPVETNVSVDELVLFCINDARDTQ